MPLSEKVEEEKKTENAAEKEFEEETGYIYTGDLTKLGSFYKTYEQLSRKIYIQTA
ncbi:MAG: hypothetical protein PHI66_03225 [Candidatus Pacebacteria bacterium]|nr:hypothetical protein [Candidatus Paceibacterota bacterium]